MSRILLLIELIKPKFPQTFWDMCGFWCLSAMRTKGYLENGWADFKVLGRSRFVIRYSIFYLCVSILIYCFVSELLPIRTKIRGFWCLSGMRTKAYLENGWTDFDVPGRSRFVIRYSIFYLCVSTLIFCVVSELFPVRTNPDQIRTESGQTRTNPTCLIEPFQIVYYSEHVCRFWCFPPEMNYCTS